MPQDAAGRPYAGVFQTIHDPDSGLTFTLEWGTGQVYRYKVTGSGASGGIIEVAYDRTLKPWYLTEEAYAQGAASRPASDMFDIPIAMSRR